MEGEFLAKFYKLLRKDKDARKLLIDISRYLKINLSVSKYVMDGRYIFAVCRIGALRGGRQWYKFIRL